MEETNGSPIYSLPLSDKPDRWLGEPFASMSTPHHASRTAQVVSTGPLCAVLLDRPDESFEVELFMTDCGAPGFLYEDELFLHISHPWPEMIASLPGYRRGEVIQLFCCGAYILADDEEVMEQEQSGPFNLDGEGVTPRVLVHAPGTDKFNMLDIMSDLLEGSLEVHNVEQGPLTDPERGYHFDLRFALGYSRTPLKQE